MPAPAAPLVSLLLLLLLLVDGTSSLFQNISWYRSSLLQEEVLAVEGASVLLRCNLSQKEEEEVLWYHPRGGLLQHQPGTALKLGDLTLNEVLKLKLGYLTLKKIPDSERDGKWQMSASVLNITAVSFSDRGRYRCSSSGGGTNATVTLRVAYGDSGLGVYYVSVCLGTFFVTMLLNAARLCLMSGHLRKTEGAIDDFFRSEGAEKLQKAFEVAKRIPILTSEKTLELAKVTHFKTRELARHIEELAKSVPLPPLILHCVGEETTAEHLQEKRRREEEEGVGLMEQRGGAGGAGGAGGGPGGAGGAGGAGGHYDASQMP